MTGIGDIAKNMVSARQRSKASIQQDNLLVAPDLLHVERERALSGYWSSTDGKTDAGGLHNQDSGQDRAAPSDQRPIYA